MQSTFHGRIGSVKFVTQFKESPCSLVLIAAFYIALYPNKDSKRTHFVVKRSLRKDTV